jgi:hypothetical protein
MEVWDGAQRRNGIIRTVKHLLRKGKTRKDADGSKARWVIVQGKIDADEAGVVMMSHPGNYNYPEPLRIWPENQNGRGDVYANFSPTKDMDWYLQPGKDHVLKYRFLVFNGHVNKEQAENAWQQYADPKASTINITNNKINMMKWRISNEFCFYLFFLLQPVLF